MCLTDYNLFLSLVAKSGGKDKTKLSDPVASVRKYYCFIHWLIHFAIDVDILKTDFNLFKVILLKLASIRWHAFNSKNRTVHTYSKHTSYIFNTNNIVALSLSECYTPARSIK